MFPKRQSYRWHTGREGESQEGLYSCGDGGFWPNVATSQIADKLEEIGDIMAASDNMPIVEADLKAKFGDPSRQIGVSSCLNGANKCP